jgi:hypothetical protein
VEVHLEVDVNHNCVITSTVNLEMKSVNTTLGSPDCLAALSNYNLEPQPQYNSTAGFGSVLVDRNQQDVTQ